MFSKPKIVGLLFGVVSAGLCGAARGTIITEGAATGGNSFPYGNSTYAGREYQQIYSQSIFPVPVLINSISFPTYNLTTSTAASYTLNISMGTTTSSPSSVGTLSFNSGSLTPEFDGTYAPTLAPGGSLTFTFATPYLYNPAGGQNLVLDLEMYAESFSPSGTVFFGLANDSNMGRIFQSSTPGNPETPDPSHGLVTTFNVSSVPEPATVTASALAGIALLRRRRRTGR